MIYKETKKYHQLIGSSPLMRTVYEKINKIAKSNVSVFITGETGTGKELCARAIHLESSRKEQPFIPLNCAAIPIDLVENELFGHVKGGYTGANKEQLGAASLADGGTLFLDEIGDMNLILQSKLLRFLQENTFHKIGSPHEEKVDVRIVCATHRNPILEIGTGRFRSDLFYRLNVVSIHLPPLRKRENDVLLVAQTFLEKYAKIEKKQFKRFSIMAEKILLNYHWPGNVRQLKNIIHNVVLLNEGNTITAEMLITRFNEEIGYNTSIQLPQNINLKREISQLEQSITLTSGGVIRPFKEIEKEVILKVIKYCNGNVGQAAKCLKIGSSTIYRKLEQWQIVLK